MGKLWHSKTQKVSFSIKNSFLSKVCHSFSSHIWYNLTYFLSNEQKIESTHLKVNVIFLEMTSNMTLTIHRSFPVIMVWFRLTNRLFINQLIWIGRIQLIIYKSSLNIHIKILIYGVYMFIYMITYISFEYFDRVIPIWGSILYRYIIHITII